MSKNRELEMRISMIALEHLGMNLYSNTPAVVSEIVANAWDADAENVTVNYNKTGVITVLDDVDPCQLEFLSSHGLLRRKCVALGTATLRPTHRVSWTLDRRALRSGNCSGRSSLDDSSSDHQWVLPEALRRS